MIRFWQTPQISYHGLGLHPPEQDEFEYDSAYHAAARILGELGHAAELPIPNSQAESGADGTASQVPQLSPVADRDRSGVPAVPRPGADVASSYAVGGDGHGSTPGCADDGSEVETGNAPRASRGGEKRSWGPVQNTGNPTVGKTRGRTARKKKRGRGGSSRAGNGGQSSRHTAVAAAVLEPQPPKQYRLQRLQDNDGSAAEPGALRLLRLPQSWNSRRVISDGKSAGRGGGADYALRPLPPPITKSTENNVPNRLTALKLPGHMTEAWVRRATPLCTRSATTTGVLHVLIAILHGRE